jgi:hypothetical protein
MFDADSAAVCEWSNRMSLEIPFAPKSFVSTEPPLKVLHVVTGLMHLPASPGFDAEAHAAMMKRVGSLVGPRCECDSYIVHAPDQS